MRKTGAILVLLFSLETAAFATWSVVAVDRATGRVVISSSTCTGTTDDFLKDIQAVVVPGKGVAACQAGVDGTHQNQTLVFEELQKGTDPSRIIELLSQDPGFQGRQYGIVDLQGRAAGHSGLGNGFVSQDMHGQGSRHGSFLLHPGKYSAIRSGGAERRESIRRGQGRNHRPGNGRHGGRRRGRGDSRCTCEVPAVPAESKSIPCTLRTSLVAYILAADPGDTNGPMDKPNLHNDGKYAMYIAVSQPNHGPAFNIKPGEDLDPVKTLRLRYGTWLTAHPEFRR